MSDSPRDTIAKAKASVARTVARSLRTLAIGIGNRTPDEIKLGFEQSQKEAPMWVHAALRIATAKVQTAEKTPDSGRTSLNVVVVGAANSVEAWQKQADSFKLATQPKPKAALIEVPSESERK